jgi:hypothetical protein
MTENVLEGLKRAASLVEEASVPSDLRSVAFASAFWATQHPADVPHSGASAPPATAEPLAHLPATADLSDIGSYERIAEKLGVPVGDAEFAFELQDQNLTLRIRPSLFDPVRAHAQQQVIYLLASARQAAGIEGETTATTLKNACKDLGKDDTNFGKVLSALHGEGLIIGGPTRSRTVKANADGHERAGEMLKSIRAPRA